MCILNNTNKYAEEFVLDKDVADKKLYEKTNMIELRAFLGILIIMGIYRDTKEDLGKLWDVASGRGIYRAAMSKRRFRALLTLIRFDDRKARKEREQAGVVNPDKLEPLREVFDKFNN